MSSRLASKTQLICPPGPHCRLGRLRTARAGGQHLPQSLRDELDYVGVTIKPELEITVPEPERGGVSLSFPRRQPGTGYELDSGDMLF